MEPLEWTGLCEGDEHVRSSVWAAVEWHCTRFLRLKGVEAEDCSDLLHDVFLEVCSYACRHADAPPVSLAGFLKGQAHGVFSKWAQGRVRRRRERDVDQVSEPPAEECDPGVLAAREDHARAVREALVACRDRLDEHLYRPIWRLRYESGFDLKRIGAWLGRDPGTVAVQLHRANAKMRACLEARGMEIT